MLSQWNIDPARVPGPADRDAAELGLERWIDAATGSGNSTDAAFARRVHDDPVGRVLLEAVFGNSPFLSQSMAVDFAFTRDLLAQDPDAAFARLLAELALARRADIDLAGAMRQMRIAKRRCSLVVGLADIAGTWPLDRVCGALSEFADAALGVAVAHLLTSAAKAGEFALRHPDDPETDSGFIVLGMGKLGAQELNYSSDVDLIVLFDPARFEYTGRGSLQQCLVRLDGFGEEELEHCHHLFSGQHRKPKSRFNANIFGVLCTREIGVLSDIGDPQWLTTTQDAAG